MLTGTHWYILNHLLLIQKKLLLIQPCSRKEPIAVPNIIQNAFVYVANNNIEVVVVVNDERELLVHIKSPVTYSAVPCSSFLIPYSNVKLVTCSLFLMQM